MENAPVKAEKAMPPQESNGGHEYVSMIERLATNPNVDVAKLEKMMDMQERVLDRDAEMAFSADMVACQAEIKLVISNQKNEQTQSRYADLQAVLGAAKPVYTKHGFALSFYEGETQKEKHVRVMVDILHRQGHTKTRFKDFPIDDVGIKGSKNKTAIHADQSTFTYGRRNLTCMVFNIPTGDDDGNAAGAPVEYISLDQQTVINDMLAETGSNVNKFLNYMGAESVELILAKKYNMAVTALKKKAEK